MTHDFSLVFDTENSLWQRVLNIFEENEEYEKKKIKGRELHHKFPRSFSKKLGEEIDNDEDNLVSLSPADHFRVHYYYYILAKKGFKQPMALAFDFMLRPIVKQMGPATMEECATDFEELRRERLVAWKESIDKWRKENPEKEQKRIKKLKATLNTPEVKEKKRKSMLGKNKGEKNGMYGKEPWSKTHSPLSMMTDEEIQRWKEAISEAGKRRTHTEETKKKISDSRISEKNPQFRRFSWKNEKGGFNNLVFPEDILNEELDEYRFMLHFLIANNDWRKRLDRLRKLCERMDDINTSNTVKNV